jgi:hypothetical protein
MISLIGIDEVQNKNFKVYYYAGLSSDTKKTAGVTNGSVFLEMDTKKMYLFDETNATWREWS